MAGESVSEMAPGISPGQVPPFHEIGEFAFQDLCRDLFDAEETVSTCNIYGVRGEEQYGIDLLAMRKNENGIEVGQCKCYKDFPPKEIREVSCKFFEHWENHWSGHNVKRFILFVASDLNTRKRQDEILKQRKRFSEYGIEYEVWPAAQIRNKLRPHRGIVSSYCHPPEHWTREICGISTPTASYEKNASAQTSVVIASALENQISQISGQISEDTVEQLNCMRKAWQEGRTSEVRKWLGSLRNGKWSLLLPEVKADVLLLEAAIELEENRDISRARKLADEAQSLMPSQNQVRFRTMILYHERGPEEAIGLLDNQDDIDSLNLKAALLLEIGRVEESLEILDIGDKSNGET